MKPLSRHRAFALLGFLVLTLAATGLAHRVPSRLAAELAAYARLGVTLADICGLGEMGAEGDGCPLCRIEPGYLPPAPPTTAAAPLGQGHGLSLALAGYRAPPAPPQLLPQPRAPPLI